MTFRANSCIWKGLHKIHRLKAFCQGERCPSFSQTLILDRDFQPRLGIKAIFWIVFVLNKNPNIDFLLG